MDDRREKPNRQSNRLPHYDYSHPGAYFVTIGTYHHVCLFGEVRDGVVHLSALGRLVDRTWQEIPDHFPGVTADDYVVMPNHVHGVIVIEEEDVGARHEIGHECDVGAAYMPPVRRITLGIIVSTFKAAVTREIHKINKYENLRVWHRNYYERVIRDEREYEQIIDYIHANPVNWHNDSEYRE